MKNVIIIITLLSIAFSSCAQQDQIFVEPNNVYHAITMKVNPQDSYLEVIDSITLDDTGDFIFSLNSNLKITFSSKNIVLKTYKDKSIGKDVGMDRDADGAPIQKFIVHFKDKSNVFILKYKGIINDDPQQKGQEYQRSFKETTGLIASKGVYLAGSSYWVPSMDDVMMTYRIKVELPKEWSSVTTGERLLIEEQEQHTDIWYCNRPQEEIYIIAARFTQYSYDMNSGYKAMAFLRTPDEGIANKYLEVTEQYMQMYESLIGVYPYTKFALVENFWQTGYGMPSFTLLGDKIIRFPFILHSSYPHELLHNWWGNSVYVDFDSGNWCEGLTAYGADHLIKQQRGQGAEYRRSTLQKYTNFVNPGNDFPLTEFVTRFDARSEAIGYGKSLMMWHMLRIKTGDECFTNGLRLFYEQNKFKKATFRDIQKAMQESSKSDLQAFFDQWLLRKGAPSLALSNIRMENIGGSFRLHFTLTQTQEDSVYKRLVVPFNILTDKANESHYFQMNQREQDVSIDIPTGKPLKLVIDGQYDVFRTLDPREVPPAFSKALASKNNLIILPSNLPEEKAKLYEAYAKAWIAGDASDNYEIVKDDEIKELPKDKTPWIIGFENRFASVVSKEIENYNSSITADSIKFENKVLASNSHGAMITSFFPNDVNRIMVYMTPGKESAIPGLIRKLPHYGKYSYLAFEGDEPTNIAKGQWPVVNSPLIHVFDANAQKISIIKPSKALAEMKPVFSEKRMMEHIQFMASEEMKGRGLGTPELDQVADYIATLFKSYGLKPYANDYFQEFSTKIPPNKGVMKMKNVIGVIPGKDTKLSQEPVVITAHYDHLGLGWPDVHQGDEGKVHYGADDNASGVAILIELAKSMSKSHPSRTIIFVATTGEEAGLLGSRFFVAHVNEVYSGPVFANINLDTDGSLFDKKLLVLNAHTAKEWKFIFMGTDYTTGIKTEIVTQGLDASDQVAFIEQGIPAVQLFTGATPNYHRPSDTYDKIDGPGLVKVATVTKEVVEYLAERDKPMPFVGEHKDYRQGEEDPNKNAVKQSGRKVSTGSIPDFAFNGEGVKVGSVMDGSAGAKAGLKAGDIITEINGEKVVDLKAYSDVLKKFKPGDKIKLTVVRGEINMELPLILGAR